mgnify:CR=1 FL=1
MDSVHKAEELIKDKTIGTLLENVNVYDLLRAHEFFHGIEYNKRRYIYTQTEKVELWRRPFSNKSKIIALSEIAGMEFARNIISISYSLFLFDVVLMYLYNKEAACMLYEDIIIEIERSFCIQRTIFIIDICFTVVPKNGLFAAFITKMNDL